MMAFSTKVPLAHKSVRPFIILLIARAALRNDFVASRQAKERTSSVIATLPHLADYPVHDLGLQ
jgi:hypothetical protein